MKKFNHGICLILTCFFTFTLIGCSTKNNDDVNAQNAVKKYLTTYFTIDKNDMELYGKINGGSKDVNELTDATAKCENKFKDLLTDKAYENLVTTRMSYGRMRDAYLKKYYVTVKNIRLEKYTEDKKEQMLGFEYTIDLTQNSISGNETKNVQDKFHIHVFKTGDTWKVAPDILP